ncbi:MAG TPA: chemotaxis protein CheX [Bryobacteraceae bacterium]|jgi:CheY-specific phosphatase CheX|nr:chemotaxis protein CheX [Bryobacteraceae bacterium]
MPEQLQSAPRTDGVTGFGAIVVRVAAQVLETMFFEEAVATACEHAWLPTAVTVHVSFEGSHRGEFLLSVAPDTARSIAAGFLGLDPEELTGTQAAEVILELANILCGALMSTLWPESALSLDTPELASAEHAFLGSMHCCFTLPDGMVAVSIGVSDGDGAA